MHKPLLQVITANRTSDGAGVSLYRSLGQSAHARVDPFLMLDEFGSDRPDEYIAGFPPHPHRGFETVTYMLNGHMLHEDHLGNKGHLKSGDVQWMTAGRGIIHSEMPQQESGLMRGFQLWINLPAKEKMKPAGYQDISASRIPIFSNTDGLWVKVIAGEFARQGQTWVGPVQGVSTAPIFWDVHLPSGQVFEQVLPEQHSTYLYVYEGELSIKDSNGQSHSLRPKQGGILGVGSGLHVTASSQGCQFLVLAAQPLGEPVVQYGPFVMNTRDEIEQAIRDYQNNALA